MESLKVFCDGEWILLSRAAKRKGLKRRTLRERRNFFIKKYGPIEKWPSAINERLFRGLQRAIPVSTRCASRDCDNIPLISITHRGLPLCPDCAVKAVEYLEIHRGLTSITPKQRVRAGYY